eukprot:TRINITY_DN12651_c0_g1_i1.p1 TRINITY_DN12651_c0_g1~~TRINITY_DN12651_c0_g1_i1.p1  ORF type:complete len:154 (+),score=7.74 TRINITY_DN12651_c0_g1_i1:59-463(+)
MVAVGYVTSIANATTDHKLATLIVDGNPTLIKDHQVMSFLYGTQMPFKIGPLDCAPNTLAVAHGDKLDPCSFKFGDKKFSSVAFFTPDITSFHTLVGVNMTRHAQLRAQERRANLADASYVRFSSICHSNHVNV